MIPTILSPRLVPAMRAGGVAILGLFAFGFPLCSPGYGWSPPEPGGGDRAASAAVPVVKDFKVLVPNRGGRVDWHPTDNTLIAFDAPNDGYHDIYTMRIDGTEQHCLTCDLPGLPPLENANPEWHPSGKWIVFQSEEPNHYQLKEDRWTPYPGIGGYANLWAIQVETRQIKKLTDFKPFMSPTDTGVFSAVHTVLHPHFNDDGTKLVWTMRFEDLPGSNGWGKWKIVMGDFSLGDGEPGLTDVRDVFVPRGPGFFVDSMGFRRGHDDELLVNGNLEGFPQYGMDIYRLSWKTGELINLTHTPTIWDEDLVSSNDGKRILFMSNPDSPTLDPASDWTRQPRWREFYIMNADDGSNVQRVTGFNVEGSREYYGGKRMAMSDVSFSPDGTRIVFDLHEDFSTDSSVTQFALRIAVIEFEGPVE